MNVTLYTFSKKHNSTAVPTGGTSVDVVLKDEAGVLDPIIELHTAASPSAYNYLYIPTFGRYYWLREWTYNRGIWTGSFYVDPLASWRTQIGAQQLYVFRSAYESDGRVIDSLYPVKADPEFKVTPIPGFWTSTGASAGGAWGSGLYVIGLIGDGEINYYGFQKPDLDKFLERLFSDDYFQSIVGAGVTISPEIKAEVNPLQYVASVRYYPAAFAAGENSWGLLNYSAGGNPTTLSAGKGKVPLNGEATVRYFLTRSSIVGTYYTNFTISDSSYDHPQQSRGKYMRGAPYTKWEVFMPPFGIIELDSGDLIDAEMLNIAMIVDIRTGSAQLDITAVVDNTGHLIARAGGNVGIDCPLTHVMQTGINYANVGQNALGAAFSAMTGNVAGTVNYLRNAIGNGIEGKKPHLSTVGSQGSGAETGGHPMIITTYYKAVDDDVAGRGRPLCSKRLISSIPGYITADPDELSIAATARELEEIRGFISGGFFYE